MRILCLIVLTCAFPFIALSQHPSDKAIIDDYAHPDFARHLAIPGVRFMTDHKHAYYLAAGNPQLFERPLPGYAVVRKLSPQHAIITIDKPSFAVFFAGFSYLLPANDSWKLSPALIERLKNRQSNLRLLIYVVDAPEFERSFGGRITVLRRFPGTTLAILAADRSVVDTLMASPLVLFADIFDKTPREELSVSGFDLGTNKVNTAHHHFPAITGEGLMVSVKENRFDSNDIDLKGRVVSSGIESSNASGHATIMATMIAGAGNSFYDGKGVAWKTSLQSATFTNLMPEPDAFYRAQNITVQNHSYGTGIENFYGADAAAYDAVMAGNPVLMHVFSAGNSGLLPSAGPYAGITGFANITGSFKMGKNMMVVGAIDSVGNVEPASSRGPTYDGRIKPEVVAYGQDGSSGAAAIVSGIVLLMQHAYKPLHHDSLPPAALVRSILINTAEDVGPKGPDFISGYGNANAYRVLRSVRQSHFIAGSMQHGGTQTFDIGVASGIRSLKITLAWTDPAAPANALTALVNNLDMELVHIPSGQVWQPWILSKFPHIDSLRLPAVRGTDTLNNVEQITLETPLPGTYRISVKGSRITTAEQSFFIAYDADTADTFQWMYPMSADPVISGTTGIARWHSGFAAGTTGTLQYNLNNLTGTWITAATNVDLSKGYVKWNVPNVFSTALLRMVTGSNTYNTDTFVISTALHTQVGFNCPDSFLFYWNKPGNVNSFRVYQRGSKYLEPVTLTPDSFFIASKNIFTSKQFTVAPLVAGREGVKAYTFDYTTQGVDCYFKSFLAQLDVNRASLRLQLGSVYRVNRILVQKLSGNAFINIQTIDAPAALQFDLTDASLHQGVNTYRIALVLQDGRTIYSTTEVVYYLDTHAYLIYPNPASVYGGFKILQQDATDVRVLMHDVTGRLMKDEVHQDLTIQINTLSLQKGLYVVTIVKDGKNVFRGKVVIAR